MKKRKGSLAVGFPTIVNILVLLLFTCVSLLALSRAQADSRAQTLLGQLEPFASLPPAEAGMEMEALLNDQGIAARYDAETQLLTFPLPAGEAGTLSVSLQLLPESGFQIHAWTLIPHESEPG